jgi:hypothetical protein
MIKKIKITALYRCDDVDKNNFLTIMKPFTEQNKDTKNHIIVEDFNIDLLEPDKLAEIYLQIFLGTGYIPYFCNITRLNNSNITKGTCIDNMSKRS